MEKSNFNGIIDLRSDTVTVPDAGMLNAMMTAEVGDDVYGEDPSVNLLEEKVAKFFGKEAALFTPTGTMANQICLKINTSPGDEIICEEDAHIFYYETAAPAMISNIQIRTIASEIGMPSLELIEKAIRPDIYYLPKTSLICMENTHNRHGGTINSLEYLKEMKLLADKYGIRTHLDGARVWNALVESDYDGIEIGKYFDTLSVCMSKGMGTPLGSLVVGSRSDIKKGLKVRKILGGGMRQAGFIAAACIYALENNIEKLKEDHRNVKHLAEILEGNTHIKINESRVQTNMLLIELDNRIDAEEFVEGCKKAGLLLFHIGDNKIRIVLHLNINREQTIKAGQIIEKVIKEIL